MLLNELTVKQNPSASRIENFNYNSLLYNKMFVWKGTSEVLATVTLLSSDGNWFRRSLGGAAAKSPTPSLKSR